MKWLHCLSSMISLHHQTRVRLRLLPTLLALAVTGPASAAVIAFYDIESLDQADSAGFTGLTASNMTVNASGTSSNFEWVGSRVPFWLETIVNDGTNPGISDIEATFSLTPDAGQSIQLGTTGAIDIGVLGFQGNGNNGTTNDYTASVRVFIASDSGFSNLLATSTILTDGFSNGADVHTVGSLNLDNAVNSSSTLYFGISLLEDRSTNLASSFNARFDGVQINGTVVPIPEPSSLVLSLAGICLLLRRRRR